MILHLIKTNEIEYKVDVRSKKIFYFICNIKYRRGLQYVTQEIYHSNIFLIE